MANTPLTLAALATSAVPGLTVVGTREHTSGSGGSFLSAVLATSEGNEVITRVPATAAAEVTQQGELMGQAALNDGARAQLPFEVPKALGMTRAGNTRAVVSTFLAGVPAAAENLSNDSALLDSVVEAIAAIHALPIGIVQQGGLPMRSSTDVRTAATRLVQRAADTGLLPETVRGRWREALATDALWGFEPVVSHGSLAPEQLLVEGDGVLGVLGWHELGLGDPAFDLAWLLSVNEETFETALAKYSTLRDLSGLREFTARARLHHELEVAKWLLHGVDSHDNDIIDDAVAMLDRLVDRLSLLGAPLPGQPVLTEHEVERLLDQTPEVPVDTRTETAEFEALDEDRAFDSAPQPTGLPWGEANSAGEQRSSGSEPNVERDAGSEPAESTRK